MNYAPFFTRLAAVCVWVSEHVSGPLDAMVLRVAQWATERAGPASSTNSAAGRRDR